MLAGFGVHHIPVSADMCIDLDTIDAAPAAEPITNKPPRGEQQRPEGMVETIGKARTMQIAVSRT
jgi:hypothetical protein